MRVTMLLADSAQAVDGKLYILGGGWSMCGPGPTPMGLAIKIEVPWDRTNMQHSARIELLDADGEVVTPPGADEPVVIEAEFEVGRPPGLKPGTPIDLPLAVNVAPLPLEPGQRYQWQLSIDGETDEDWTVGFSTRPAKP